MRQRATKRRLAIASFAAVLVIGSTFLARPVRAEARVFDAGSLIIPMDLAYQDLGMFQAYGLLFQLLRQGVMVHWVIEPSKTWHAAPCDAVDDECAWDCAEEDTGVKCPYPTASPDFYVGATVLWDDQEVANPGDVIVRHGYRGGPFVIADANRDAALAIINAWNDPALWGANPWADRDPAAVVTVHSASASFSANVVKDMVAAPTIAVFSDGNEDVATRYLIAAGIAQSNGTPFPADRCKEDPDPNKAVPCGPGTDNPDMLTVPSIMGDMGTCGALNYDHKNGSLFTEDGLPAFCQIMSMHWSAEPGKDRDLVQCDGAECPPTQGECAADTKITYHGHEVVAEVREFLKYPTHFFAECQAVNAYENTTPNPAWPYLDDAARDGHFLTDTGMPPECPATDCDDGSFETVYTCEVGGCDGIDCCLPTGEKGRELGAGFLIADQPNSATIQVLHPEVPYNQFDGAFETTGGSEPAYNLSTFLGTAYKNDREVTFITGPTGPGKQDVWMTGYIDGQCDITDPGDDVGGGGGTEQCTGGKVSYLGGHDFQVNTPVSDGGENMGTRLFLNALFEADCVTSVGQPNISLNLSGDLVLGAQTVPVTGNYTASYSNLNAGYALDAVMAEVVAGATVASDGSAAITDGVEWTVGSISGNPLVAGGPPNSGSRASTITFPDFGDYQVELRMSYAAGTSVREVPPQTITVRVALDSDGDGVPDVDDPSPNDPNACGDSDMDTCDDCAVAGMRDPANDGPDADGNGICDAGEGVTPGDGGKSGGCGCRVASPTDATPWLILLVGVALLRRRRM